MNCQEKIDFKSIGYDQYYKTCSRKAKFEIEWKTSSGTFKKVYCKKHYEQNLRFIQDSNFQILISSNELNNIK